MPIEQLDPKTTWDHVQSDPQALILDVRTVEEFTAGHPQNAYNIPILCLDARTGQKVPNLDFDDLVQSQIPKDKNIYLSCHSGQRSMMAAMKMEAMGYDQLVNVKGGFAGSQDTTGWQDCGLPTAEGRPEGRSYDDLTQKAKG